MLHLGGLDALKFSFELDAVWIIFDTVPIIDAIDSRIEIDLTSTKALPIRIDDVTMQLLTQVHVTRVDLPALRGTVT